MDKILIFYSLSSFIISSLIPEIINTNTSREAFPTQIEKTAVGFISLSPFTYHSVSVLSFSSLISAGVKGTRHNLLSLRRSGRATGLRLTCL